MFIVHACSNNRSLAIVLDLEVFFSISKLGLMHAPFTSRKHIVCE